MALIPVDGSPHAPPWRNSAQVPVMSGCPDHFSHAFPVCGSHRIQAPAVPSGWPDLPDRVCISPEEVSARCMFPRICPAFVGLRRNRSVFRMWRKVDGPALHGSRRNQMLDHGPKWGWADAGFLGAFEPISLFGTGANNPARPFCRSQGHPAKQEGLERYPAPATARAMPDRFSK